MQLHPYVCGRIVQNGAGERLHSPGRPSGIISAWAAGADSGPGSTAPSSWAEAWRSRTWKTVTTAFRFIAHLGWWLSNGVASYGLGIDPESSSLSLSYLSFMLALCISA
jgi:hypothetical protein